MKAISGEDEMQKDTATILVEHALQEFCEQSYFQTNSNRIAKRAGFAPQTFYRWFKDKDEIFLAVYKKWCDIEIEQWRTLIIDENFVENILNIVIQHHQHYVLFRRSLRQLSVEQIKIREARAIQRVRQYEFIQQKLHIHQQYKTLVIGYMLQIERLADALAEGEIIDMQLIDSEIRQLMLCNIQQIVDLGKKTLSM